ncbi:alpha/beta hydrolase [Kutzneria sp. CA-103260]|nr:alpha/beta hydrolase [Kutzneria sp. CA-103260]
MLVTLAMTAGLTTGGMSDTAQWQGCPGGLPAPLECTSVQVPMDYGNPGGSKISIEVSRVKATGRRRGALMMNPGGPGSPGIQMPLQMAQSLPKSVTDEYDLIGFDPRGTGRSAPVDCGFTPGQIDLGAMGGYPSPDGSIAASVDHARTVAQRCVQDSGPDLPYITTNNTARDMDRIRAALGEQQISYYGTSYGTYLGAVYSTMFPQRSDRIVLDSVNTPNDLWRGTFLNFGQGMADRFPDFASWAAAQDAALHLGATPDAVRATYLGLAAQLDQTPLPTKAGPVSGNTFREQTREYLYNTVTFPDLAQLWQAVKTGDADAVQINPSLQVILSGATAIWCNDAEWPRNIAAYQRDVLRNRQQYPLTAGMPAGIEPCAFWPYRPAEPVTRITDHGPSNILLAQNERDPATPLRGALEMRKALGSRARMVTANAGGHGAYRMTGNACLDGVVTAFLTDGTRPDNDVRC